MEYEEVLSEVAKVANALAERSYSMDAKGVADLGSRLTRLFVYRFVEGVSGFMNFDLYCSDRHDASKRRQSPLGAVVVARYQAYEREEEEADCNAYDAAVASTDKAVADLNADPTLAKAEAVSSCYGFESDMSKEYSGCRIRRNVTIGMNAKARNVYRYWWKKEEKRISAR